MMVDLGRLLSIYKASEVDDLIVELCSLTLKERVISENAVKDNWRFVGDNPSNSSVINILKSPDKGIIERLTNGIDAVLEKEKKDHNISMPKSAGDIVKIVYPKFYEHSNRVKQGIEKSSYAFEALDKVVLSINDGSTSAKPTIDIIDKGTGLTGADFPNTILSINKGNKLSSEKEYLIGAFGQGGSTSLSHSYATIIVSKNSGKYFWTVVKGVQLKEYKTQAFMYYVENGEVPEGFISDSDELTDNQVVQFFEAESGTLIRMIETEVSREFRSNDITKPGMLGDYVNTELFNVALPVKMVENRKNYVQNKNAQNRNSFGSLSKLCTWKYSRQEYRGSLTIDHKNNSYKVDYFVILPDDESDWGKDAKCKETYQRFNTSLNPIIYTVNGQFVTSESFTKLRNANLNFMQYRLLVVVDLDILGNEKYQFFTTDRSSLKKSDLAAGFVDSIVDALSKDETLIGVNEMIAEKSLSANVDSDLLKEISKEIKAYYQDFLVQGHIKLSGKTGVPLHKNEEVYIDHIEAIKITTTKNEFYANEDVKLILSTGAMKSVNESAEIFAYIDGKAYYSAIKTCLNGRIQYIFPSIDLGIGFHEIQFSLYKNSVEVSTTEEFKIEIINKLLDEPAKTVRKDLDLNIIQVEDKELIVSISKNSDERKIDVYLCLQHDMLAPVYGKRANADAINSIKAKLIKPTVMYALLLDDIYETIESEEQKNKMMAAFAQSFMAS